MTRAAAATAKQCLPNAGSGALKTKFATGTPTAPERYQPNGSHEDCMAHPNRHF